jgi:hypothetical protein
MTPEERAELDRLLDLQERETLMGRVPTPAQDQHRAEQVEAEMAEMAAIAAREHAAVRARRAQVAPDAEWIDGE